MIANQIPLEDQAEDSGVGEALAPGTGGPTPEGKTGAEVFGPNRAVMPVRQSTLTQLLSKIRENRNDQHAITIVAFSDPNDLLSQDLTPGFAQGATHVLNVAVSNANTYVGWIELPNDAHCGYGGNQAVIDMVVTGRPDRGQVVPDSVLNLACSASDSTASAKAPR